MLHVIYTWLCPGHLSVCVGDSSRRSEKVVKKANPKPGIAVSSVMMTMMMMMTMMIIFMSSTHTYFHVI